MKKKSVLHTAILTHCTARQVLRDPFSTNQWNNLEMTFVEESTRNQSQKFENQAMIGWVDAGTNLKASII